MTEHTGPDIHDHVNELTRTHQHRERYEVRHGLEVWTKDHTTRVPALILQLLGATPASQASDNGATAFGSRPAARIEALDTVMLIDDEATRWLYRLGEDDPNEKRDPRTGQPIPSVRATTGQATIKVIQKLHSVYGLARPCHRRAGRDCCTAHHIEHDIRRWWHQARITSGWDSPAWRPDNTCPVCGIRRALRVNLASQTAMCVECREVWGQDTIGLLAEHIRAENFEDESA